MKNIFLILVLFLTIPAFGQRSISHVTIKVIESRMTDLESSLFLVDSLYQDYLNNGSFTIRDGEKSDLFKSGSSWIYNCYAALGKKYPKQCPECKTKSDEVMSLIDREMHAEMEIQYRKVIKKSDDCLQQRDFLKAKEYYQRAVNFMPSDPYPKKKLEETERLLFESYNQQKFDSYILAADSLFAAKDFENAKEQYLYALTIKATDSYAVQKIAEIDLILEDRKKSKH